MLGSSTSFARFVLCLCGCFLSSLQLSFFDVVLVVYMLLFLVVIIAVFVVVQLFLF